MIQPICISSRQERLDLLKAFNPANGTWVVADLEHKTLIQNKLLELHGWLPEDACLRATELWTKIAKQSGFNQRIVSPMFMQSFAASWLKKENSALTLLAYTEFFLPILVNPEASELLREWMKAKPNSIMRWGRWFEMADQFWQHLQEKKILLSKWIPALLSGGDHDLKWQRNLLLDLGPDLSATELDVFKTLSSSTENKIEILHLPISWFEKYPKVFWPYQQLFSEQGYTPDKNAAIDPVTDWQCVRTSTQLSEVKYATSQIRKWLDSGYIASDVSIITNNPEDLWPVISAYFEEEGLPIAKKRVALAHSLPSISTWLSQLNLLSNPLSSEDFEQKLFHVGQIEAGDYQKFRTLLTNIYEESDLRRWKYKQDKNPSEQKIKASINLKDPLNREEFVQLCLAKWNLSEDTVAIKKIISTLLLECEATTKFIFKDWMHYLSALAARTELEVSPLNADGIKFRKLTSTYMNTERRSVFLNLSEDGISEVNQINVSLSEVLQIQADLGLSLSRPEPGRLQFLLDWAYRDIPEQNILSFPEADFAGQSLAPSIFWLEHKLERPDSFIEPSQFSTRWDIQQESAFDKMHDSENLISNIHMDMGRQALPSIEVKQEPSLSPSQFEHFAQCSFKFLSEKLLRLRAEPEVDLDLDRMRKGSLMHKALELLLVNEPKNIKRESLSGIIDEARFAIGLQVQESMWPMQKRTYTKLLNNFLDFELEWRKKFPLTKTIGRELEFQGELFGLAFRGKIDRVDTCADAKEKPQYLVLDYKSSGSSATNYNSWLQKNSYQLLSYVLAIEKGWTSLPAGPVVGAFFFNLKDMDREKGFGLKDRTADLFPSDSSKRFYIDEKSLEALKEQFLAQIALHVEKIKAGNFQTNPIDPANTCPSCDWRTLCRAPHLNL